jgi:glycogen debranching enzyme
MSYHNGSVWPHDNAMIAMGVRDSSDKALAVAIVDALLDLSIFVDLHRLPELICGFSRRPGKAPTSYPVACSPQAWAAGAVFMAIQSCLGLSIDARESRICVRHSALPEAVPQVTVRNLRVRNGSIDLRFQRQAYSVAVEILRKTGDIEVLVLK